MNTVLDRIVASKREEISLVKQRRDLQALQDALHTAPEVRDFLGAVRGHDHIRLIAEVKKASPSKGLIRPQFHPVDIAVAYEQGGAAAISVLTDEPFFQGRLEYLTEIRRKVAIPILRKDFILDEYQVYEARVAGADAVLLIAECLPGDELQRLYHIVRELGMTALIELYEPEHLERVLATGTLLVGVNNRDLKTFAVDLEHVIRLRSQIPSSVTLVAESGIFYHEDVRRLDEAGIDAILVGESLMRQPDVRLAVRQLMEPASE
ncbi:MAG: indole-3-glycerol phosphate synthase TrpC [Pirellula sp.]|jgi:indole-3-glycerol phosphate synthase|nr:indole-3-glycerol phosphate synthase TrpC [Pirellula sp.]